MTRVIPAVLLVVLVAAANPPAPERRTLVRESDPVIVVAKDARPLAGMKISGMRVYAFRDGRFEPIPFQVDEKTRGGDFVFPHGREKNPQHADGVFNGHDELVMMARDLGDRIPKVSERISGYERAHELSVRDPVDDGRAFAYVLYFVSDPPALSPIDYVSIDPATSRITARNYTLGFSPEVPMSINELRVTEAGGGDNVNYCDRAKARFSCVIAGVKIEKNEEDFEVEMTAWIDGPVRVVRRTRSRLILLAGIPTPSARLDNIYYYNSFSFPVEVYLPIDVGFVVKDPQLRISMDSPRLAGERRYRNSLYPEGVIQDGKMSEREKELAADQRPFTWSSTGTVGPDGKDHGAWINLMLVESDNPDWKPRVFYIDDENHLDPPDDEPGSFGNAGYQISGITNLSAGTYHVETVMYSVPVFEPAMVELYLRILDHPLEQQWKNMK